MKKIIDRNITPYIREDIIRCMQSCIEETLNLCDGKTAEWLQCCTMDEYFYEWEEIWNGDTHVGIGLDLISKAVVLNDDTRDDFETCFDTARDNAFSEYLA